MSGPRGCVEGALWTTWLRCVRAERTLGDDDASRAFTVLRPVLERADELDAPTLYELIEQRLVGVDASAAPGGYCT